MAVVIVYHSETGHTRMVAEQVAKRTNAILIPVHDQTRYNAVTRYLVGARLAWNRRRARIEPAEIDVSIYDGIVIGSPVWAWHPTPAINAAIDALKGCESKPGIIFITSNGMPGETVEMLKMALSSRNINVRAMFHFNRSELQDPKKIGEMTSAILTMRNASLE